MAIEVNGESNFTPREIIPSGSYIARTYSMVVLGTHEEEFQGVKKMVKKVRITWELPTETRVFKEENGEQPFVISKEYTMSLAEKANLRAMIESWAGKTMTPEQISGFDLTKLLGKTCMIGIKHKLAKNGKTYAEISTVSPLPKGTVCPVPYNPVVEFNIDFFDQTVFNALPKFLQEKITSSEEYMTRKFEQEDEPVGEEFVPGDPNDDLEF